MSILVDDEERRVTFLYRLEEGVAEGSFGMHCASMCGINKGVIERAEQAAEEWEATSRVGRVLKVTAGQDASGGKEVPLGLLSDIACIMKESNSELEEGEEVSKGLSERGLEELMKCIEML